MTGKNKHESTKLRKKFRKSPQYRCCFPPTGNIQKLSKGYCCTFPQVYRRYDLKLASKWSCKFLDDIE